MVLVRCIVLPVLDLVVPTGIFGRLSCPISIVPVVYSRILGPRIDAPAMHDREASWKSLGAGLLVARMTGRRGARACQ